MCSQTFLVLCINTGTRLDEEVHTGGSRALDGPHEGCASTEGWGIYGGPGLHQKFNKFHLASVSRMVEGRPEELVTHIHIRPVRNRYYQSLFKESLTRELALLHIDNKCDLCTSSSQVEVSSYN